MEAAGKRILVAIDGSVYSSNALDYLIRLFGRDEKTAIHLLSVVSSQGSDQNWMMEVDPLRQYPPEVQRKRRQANKYIQDGEARLLRNGFTRERVSASVEISRAGIATCIHREANKGMYDALLLGRRGIGRIGEMFFGSTSAYILEKCHEIPLWIIDGEVTSNRFLAAVHCSTQSLLAMDHLGFIMKGQPETEVFLYHSSVLFGGKTPPNIEEFRGQWGKDWCDKYLDPEDHLFCAHTQLLIENGIPAERIHRLPIQADVDPSHDLLRQASANDCGTIVLGRRGRDVPKSFFGGVSDRTMARAKDHAVWVVG